MRITLAALALALAGAPAVARPGPAKPTPSKPAPAPVATRVTISVTPRGFEPARITVTRGAPMVLAFTRKTEATCAKSVTLELGDGTRVTRELPLDKTVEIAATFAKAGELRYACSMDMIRGVLVVQ